MKNIFKCHAFHAFFIMIIFLMPRVVSAQWAHVRTSGTTGISAGVAYYNSIVFNADKNLYVAYQDGVYDHRVTVKN